MMVTTYDQVLKAKMTVWIEDRWDIEQLKKDIEKWSKSGVRYVLDEVEKIEYVYLYTIGNCHTNMQYQMIEAYEFLFGEEKVPQEVNYHDFLHHMLVASEVFEMLINEHGDTGWKIFIGYDDDDSLAMIAYRGV